jgi:predicted nucleotidyltransferase
MSGKPTSADLEPADAIAADAMATDAIAADVARKFAAALAPRWQALLEHDLLGVYLLGSLAHGGFSRRYSDIDVAVVSKNGLMPDQLEAMRAAASALSTELAAKLSIFFTNRSFSEGRFPPLDRIDYVEHRVALLELRSVTPARPDLTEIRAYLCGKPFEAWQQTAARFAAAETLETKDHKAYLRAHLYPARFIYSFMTGRMGSNDDAVAWLKDHAPSGVDLGLIQDAQAVRRAAADPDALFPCRRALPVQVAACAALVANTEVAGR